MIHWVCALAAPARPKLAPAARIAAFNADALKMKLILRPSCFGLYCSPAASDGKAATSMPSLGQRGRAGMVLALRRLARGGRVHVRFHLSNRRSRAVVRRRCRPFGGCHPRSAQACETIGFFADSRASRSSGRPFAAHALDLARLLRPAAGAEDGSGAAQTGTEPGLSRGGDGDFGAPGGQQFATRLQGGLRHRTARRSCLTIPGITARRAPIPTTRPISGRSSRPASCASWRSLLGGDGGSAGYRLPNLRPCARSARGLVRPPSRSALQHVAGAELSGAGRAAPDPASSARARMRTSAC